MPIIRFLNKKSHLGAFIARSLIVMAFSLTVLAELGTLDAMSDAELDAKLQHSYTQSISGEGRSLGDVFDDLERGLG